MELLVTYEYDLDEFTILGRELKIIKTKYSQSFKLVLAMRRN
jgi:hypothetical protein